MVVKLLLFFFALAGSKPKFPGILLAELQLISWGCIQALTGFQVFCGRYVRAGLCQNDCSTGRSWVLRVVQRWPNPCATCHRASKRGEGQSNTLSPDAESKAPARADGTGIQTPLSIQFFVLSTVSYTAATLTILGVFQPKNFPERFGRCTKLAVTK
jgi:hypothetical protein